MTFLALPTSEPGDAFGFTILANFILTSFCLYILTRILVSWFEAKSLWTEK